MIQTGWLFAGVVALIATGGAVYTDDDALAIITGVAGVIGWGVWIFGALNVQVFRDATVYSTTHPALAVFGLAMAIIPAWIALTGPIESIKNVRDPDMTDV